MAMHSMFWPSSAWRLPASLVAVSTLFVGVSESSAQSVMAWGRTGFSNIDEVQGNVAAFDVGRRHVVALGQDGTVACWGQNSFGQCNVPADFGAANMVAAGEYHTIARKQDGSIACWGLNDWGQCNVPAGLGTIVMIDAGSKHSFALRQNGSVACWGSNLYG